MTGARPFSIRTGPQKDYDLFISKQSLEVFIEIFDNADTVSNYEQTTLTDNTIVLSTYVSFQYAILVLEKLFKAWKANGIGGVTVDANTYSLFYYFNLYYEKALDDTLDAQAYTDLQVDVNSVPTPDEPHIEEWMQRLGAFMGLGARKLGVPGINRLWDSNGDGYQIDVFSAIHMLEALGAYIGAIANTAVFTMQYTKQFNHRLSDISIGRDSPLPSLLSYLDDPSGITPGSVWADHAAVLDVSGLPNQTEAIKSMLQHNFKISNFGMNYGRKFYGYGKTEEEGFTRHWVSLFGPGSDSLASDQFVAAPGIAALIHVWSLYTDAVNAMEEFLNHPHNSWANLKTYASKAFTDAGLSKFGGYAESTSRGPLKHYYLLVDNTVSNGLYTNLARMDEAADTGSDIIEALNNPDAGESLFVDHMNEQEVLDTFVFFIFNSMELNAEAIALRYTTGVLMMNSVGQEIAWVWDADSTDTLIQSVWQQNLAQASWEGIFDLQIASKPLTLSAENRNYIVYQRPVPVETIEIEYINHHDILGELVLRSISVKPIKVDKNESIDNEQIESENSGKET